MGKINLSIHPFIYLSSYLSGRKVSECHFAPVIRFGTFVAWTQWTHVAPPPTFLVVRSQNPRESNGENTGHLDFVGILIYKLYKLYNCRS